MNPNRGYAPIAGDFWVYRRVCTNRTLKWNCCPTLLSAGPKFTCVCTEMFSMRSYWRNLSRLQEISLMEIGIVRVEFPLRTSPGRAFQNLQNEMEVFDTFNSHAWCPDLTVKFDILTFRWHHFRSFLDDRSHGMVKWSCPRNNKECSTIVAWVEPVWVHPSADLGWMFWDKLSYYLHLIPVPFSFLFFYVFCVLSNINKSHLLYLTSSPVSSLFGCSDRRNFSVPGGRVYPLGPSEPSKKLLDSSDLERKNVERECWGEVRWEWVF